MLPGPRTVKIAVQPRYSAASASFKVKSAKTFRPIAIKAPIWEFKTIPCLYRQPSFVHIKSSFQRPQIRYFSTQNVGETNTTEEPLFTIEGNNVPSAIPSFEAIPSFPPTLRETVANLGWKSLIKVQQYAIPAALQNRDLLISSQTGTGKTAAFLIPMVMNILNDRKSNPPSQFDYAVSPRGLVLVPTRELAQQVAREASKLCVGTNVRSMAIFGGTGIRGQLQDLQSRRPDIIIATPGRLLDLRARGAITSSRIKHVVLDEGDMMLDMGFMPQVKEVLGDPTLNPKRQLCFFSATFPKEIKKVAEQFLRDPVKIFVGLNKPSALITQKVVYVSGNSEKEQMLLDFVRSAGVSSRTLVFAQTKKRTDALFHLLRFNGIRVACIHGDHIQVERDLAVEAFSKGDVSVLVATNVASRGLDIKGVSHVVNYDFPQSMEPYIHRIGRTGRAGVPGTALSFFSDNDFELAADLKQVLEECKQVIPDFLSKASARSFRNLSTSAAPSDMPFDASSPLPTTGRGNWMESRGSPQRSFSQPYQQQPYQQRPPPYQQQPYQQRPPPYQQQPYRQPYQQSNRAPASWWGPQQHPQQYQSYQQPPGPYQQPPQPYQQPPQPYQQPPQPYQQPPQPYQQPPQPYQQPPQPYQQPPQPSQQPPQPSQQPPQRKPGGLDLMSLLDDKPE